MIFRASMHDHGAISNLFFFKKKNDKVKMLPRNGDLSTRRAYLVGLGVHTKTCPPSFIHTCLYPRIESLDQQR